METRASHIIVGSFVLLFISGLIMFAIWVTKVDLDAEYSDYDIYFNGTVSGLVKRGTVFYLGIPVGEVRDIMLAPNDPRKVRVVVRLRAEVPVNEGAIARLEFQGLTGVAYIELTGGSPNAPFIIAKEGEERPVIPAEASAFQAIYENAPNLVDEAIVSVVQIQKMLSDENIQEVTSILQNVNRLSSNLADGTNDLDSLLSEARNMVVQLNSAASAFTVLAENGNDIVLGDVKTLMFEATTTLRTTNQLISRIDDLVAASEGSVTQFVNGSLPEVTRMIIDLRTTSRNLSRLMSRIEADPAGTFFGGTPETYDMQLRQKKEDK